MTGEIFSPSHQLWWRSFLCYGCLETYKLCSQCRNIPSWPGCIRPSNKYVRLVILGRKW